MMNATNMLECVPYPVFDLRCKYVPMCPHVGTGWRHSHNLQYVLSTVNSCDGICPFLPFGQWFDTQLQPLRLVVHCVLMCLYMPMCPHMEWFE